MGGGHLYCIDMIDMSLHSKETVLAFGISADHFQLQNNRLKHIWINTGVKYQWWCFWHPAWSIRVISMILCPLELIFSVVFFDGFSCLEKSLCDHSYQSSDSSSMVDEEFKILHHRCIRIRKVKADKSIFLYSFGFLSWLSALIVWSIEVRSLYIVDGHIQIIALYWGHIEL